ncbi:MAG: hypothetical protein M3463_06310, partial [Verrucomicrobiota bacterium]|nr:hypothetical protein [Verrucomicrobiota bacterium]
MSVVRNASLRLIIIDHPKAEHTATVADIELRNTMASCRHEVRSHEKPRAKRTHRLRAEALVLA